MEGAGRGSACGTGGGGDTFCGGSVDAGCRDGEENMAVLKSRQQKNLLTYHFAACL